MKIEEGKFPLSESPSLTHGGSREKTYNLTLQAEGATAQVMDLFKHIHMYQMLASWLANEYVCGNVFSG